MSMLKPLADWGHAAGCSLSTELLEKASCDERRFEGATAWLSAASSRATLDSTLDSALGYAARKAGSPSSRP